jgi:hypothetical protein
MGDIKFSVFSKGGEQRSAHAVGIWRKYFLCSNQAGSSPHERWMKFSENDFSWRDLFCFCFCGKTPKPHGIWLSATSGMRIFSYEQAFRFSLIFQKTTKSEQKQTIGKQEIHTTVQALNFIFLNHQSHE